MGNDTIEKGYGWAFPVSKSVFRVGIGTCKKIDYIKRLDSFIEKFDHGKTLSTMGGFMPTGLSKIITKNNIICVGDSASQALPLTIEGIRPIIYLAKFLSEQVKDYSCEKLSLETLKESYTEHCKKAFPYSALINAQKLALNVNDVTFASMKPLMKNGESLLRKYFGE
jgi:flavin-dependent dehydrogenase